MTLQERLRKIREYRGYKQSAAAREMNITQQAYSYLESKSGNLKMETIQRFCDVMKVEIPFLLAFEIPVTDENLQIFDNMNISSVVSEYKKLTNKIAIYEDLLRKDAGVNRSENTQQNNPTIIPNPEMKRVW